jgi:alpha-1,6-mannosyltransferase
VTGHGNTLVRRVLLRSATRARSGPGSGIVTSGTALGLADGVKSLLAVPAADRRHEARARAEQFPRSATAAAMLAAHSLDRTSI